jgi:mitogen-activated protein kinase 1/3
MTSNFQHLKVGSENFFIDQRYCNLKPMGHGRYGICASAVDSISKQEVSINKIQNINSTEGQRILRDLKVLKHLSGHENILSFSDLMVSDHPTCVGDLYLVTNLFHSDLERIIRSKQPLTTEHLQYFLYQMLRGLKYVHSANIIHRDLKPSNILVNLNCDLFLSDFISARTIDPDMNVPNAPSQEMTEYVATRRYRAPELLYSYPYYGKPIDIWAMGCIFAELILKEPIVNEGDIVYQFKAIVEKLGFPPMEKLNLMSSGALRFFLTLEGHRPLPFHAHFPVDFDEDAIDLLEKMLKFHPNDRITAEEALKHPFLKDMHYDIDETVIESVFHLDCRSEEFDCAEVSKAGFIDSCFSSLRICLCTFAD